MAQTGFTPVSLYYTATTATAPLAANLVNGELAINITDGNLYYKDNNGVVQIIASKNTSSGSFVNLAYTGTLTGGTGIVNIGSGQIYKDAAGKITLGGTSTTGQNLTVKQNITGAVSSFGVVSEGVIQSDVTTLAILYESYAKTAAASFTLPLLAHFDAVQGPFGAGSTVTTQVGFLADSTLTGGTNNIGFYGNIASGTNRWNFYANGTAPNYFGGDTTFNGAITGSTSVINIGSGQIYKDTAGKITLGGTATTGQNLTVKQNITGATSSYGVVSEGVIQSDVTTLAALYDSFAKTAAASFTLGTLYHYVAVQGTFGAGSTVTTQVGHTADASLIGATNNIGFLSNIPSGTGRWNYYAGGTATNYFAGDTIFNSKIGLGSATSPSYGTSGQVLTSGGPSASPTWTSATSGTVTSVSWTGGIVSVANSTSTPAFTIAGTSGGIPYFSSASTWASSAALAASALVIGGGAGSAPSTTTTGTGVLTALAAAANGSGGFVTDTGTVSLTNKTLTGTKETIFAITDAAAFEINPANGGIQTITLSANRTPKGTSFTAGQSVTLMVTAGSFTLTWTDTTFGPSGVKWLGASAPGSAPTLSTTAITIIELWKVGSQVYGALVGVA